MKPTIPDVIDRFRAYHARPEGGMWGSLHIVLADGNASDGDVRWCIEYAREHGDDEGVALGEILLTMSRTQRLKIGWAGMTTQQEAPRHE